MLGLLEYTSLGRPPSKAPARLERVWAQLMHIMAQLEGAAACLVTQAILPAAIRTHDQRTSHLHTWRAVYCHGAVFRILQRAGLVCFKWQQEMLA